MGGTKGSHIVLDHPELLEATGGREIFFEHSDGRIVLIYPLHGRVLVGTTDLEADPRERGRVHRGGDRLLLRPHRPRVPHDRAHRATTSSSRYSGIRPLPRHDDLTPGLVSRDYRIEVDAERHGSPVLSLVGGKWTTFRALGETLADRVLELLDRPRARSTDGVPIGGGSAFPTTDDAREEWLTTHLGHLSRDRAVTLFERYGTRAIDVSAFMDEDDDEPLLDGALSTREVAYMASVEGVVHVSDVVLRRTTLAFVGGISAADLRQIAKALGSELGWSPARVRAEAKACAEELRDFHSVKNKEGAPV